MPRKKYPYYITLDGSNIENHIRRVLANYPSLFKTRMDVLHHIFIVCGTGYDWTEDGKLKYQIFTDRDEMKIRPQRTIPKPDRLTCSPYPFPNLAATIPDNADQYLAKLCAEIAINWATEKIIVMRRVIRNDLVLYANRLEAVM